jgi:hypothetical protein
VAALSPAHQDLVQQLGGARHLELVAHLKFNNGNYVGGDETYRLVRRGSRAALLRVEAEIRVRTSRPASPRTSPAQR